MKPEGKQEKEYKMAENEKVEVKSKEYAYRGKPLDYLKSLDVRESAKFMSSRSRRTINRNFDVIEKFVKLCEAQAARSRKIRTHLRDIVIVPRLVGHTIGIYNGKEFQDVLITHEMIGHRLGEFAMTRVKVNHGSAGIGATKGSKAQKK